MAEIIEIDEFEPAFPVAPDNRNEVMRRFGTLFFDKSYPCRYGSNGVVSKAQNAFGEIFAVKRLRVSLDETPLPDIPPAKATSGAVAAFRNEYENQLSISNVKGFPKLYGYGSVGGEPLILMEWIDGISLTELLGQSSQQSTKLLEPDAVMTIGAELFSILSRLDALSSRPVHRDISPSNIIVRTSALPLSDQKSSGEYDLCIIDFGSTTLIDEQNPTFTAMTQILRHATPEYAPPEMLTDTLPDILKLRRSPSIDVYAACSILYQALTGHTPYRLSERPGEVPYLIKSQAPPPPLTIPGYQRACAAIMQGLEQDQSKRPAASYLRDVLREACGKLPNASSSSQPSLPRQASPFQARGSTENITEEVGAPTLSKAQGTTSVREASFVHASDPEVGSEESSGINRYPLISRRKIIVLAACAGAALLIGGGAAFAILNRGSDEKLASKDQKDETGIPEQQNDGTTTGPSYTGGTLYSAQDPDTKLWGYLNAQREWAIPPSFENVPGLFVDGLALVKDQDSGKYGYINEKGTWTLEPKYPAANMFGEGLAFAQAPEDEGGPLGGWIDAKGNWAIAPAFYGGGVFSNGLAAFTSTNTNTSRWGYLNAKGECVIEEQFLDAGSFADNGLALASVHVGLYGWIDQKGNWAIEPQYGNAQSFSEGMAAYMETFSEKWGYIDSLGNEVIPPRYTNARRFKNGLASCQDADTQLWGFINTDGEWAIEPQFSRAGDFAHGLAPAQDADSGNFGYIDDTGYWVIPPQYSDVNLNITE